MAIAVALLAQGSASAQVACQPGYQAALAGPHGATYQALFAALNPHTTELRNRLGAVMNGATYVNLLNLANSIATNNNARLVITLPDGTVVIDTNRNDGPSNPQNNAYPNFVAKTINENHNSRVAILAAQTWPCGTAVETKTSTSTGEVENYVAVRLGNHLDSQGTARLSHKE
jgi:hypothetical protein